MVFIFIFIKMFILRMYYTAAQSIENILEIHIMILIIYFIRNNRK